MFATLQDRLPKELTLAGIVDIAAANRFIRAVYLPEHNARFAHPPEIAESAFVAAEEALLKEILCREEARIVARDNTVAYGDLRLQLPPSPARHHYVRARVKLRHYPDGTIAIFHGPRRLAHYDAAGGLIDHPPCRLPRDPLRRDSPGNTTNRSGQMMCYKNRTTPSATDRPRVAVPDGDA